MSNNFVSNYSDREKVAKEKLDLMLRKENSDYYYLETDIPRDYISIYGPRIKASKEEKNVIRKALEKYSGPFWKIDLVILSDGRNIHGNLNKDVLGLTLSDLQETKIKYSLKQLTKAYETIEQVLEIYRKLEEGRLNKLVTKILNEIEFS